MLDHNPSGELIVGSSVPAVREVRSSNSSSAGEEFRNRSVYQTLAIHQRQEEWGRREIMSLLQLWAARFILEFKLEIPEVALCLDQLSIREAGHFRYGHNGFGLRGEIALNTRYLPPHREFWEVLGVLLHELLHAWQQAHGHPGKGNHHNREFRDKARDLGLVIDERGVTGYSARTPFKDLLQEQGVWIPEGEVLPVEEKRKGASKLLKWSCGCTNIRVAVPHFRALCLNCHREFRQMDSDCPAAHRSEAVSDAEFSARKLSAQNMRQ